MASADGYGNGSGDSGGQPMSVLGGRSNSTTQAANLRDEGFVDARSLLE